MKYIKFFAASLCLFFAVQTAFAQNNGILDASFAPTIESLYVASVAAVAKQPDGKIIVGGLFTLANERERYNLARFNTDGSLDDSFRPSIPAYPPGIKSIAVLSDGKILVAGYFINPLTQELGNIARLNADGTFDSAFKASTNGIVNVMTVQPDGKIVIAGNFSIVNNQTRWRIARLNADGTTDTTFGYSAVTIDAMALQTDGKIIISEVASNSNSTLTYKISRLNPNGSLDASFAVATGTGIGYRARTLKLQADGKILVGGSFVQINGATRSGLARLNTDGSVDAAFNPALTPTRESLLSINAIEIDADGRILIGGNFSAVNGATRNRVARLNADGSTDTSFVNQTGADEIVYGVVTVEGGKIFIIGNFRSYGGEQHYRVARLDADGNPDASFSARINSNGYIKDIEIQPDGKILVAGAFFHVNGTAYGAITRFLPDGTVDPTFATYQQSGLAAEQFEDIELQPDGKIIVVGIVFVGGNSNTLAVARVNANGTYDNTFTPVVIGDNSPKAVKVLANGQILAAGDFTRINGVQKTNIVKINSNGSIDASFNPVISGVTNSGILDLAVRNDGKIVIGGYFMTVNGTAKKNLALLNADGTLDDSFTANTSDYAVYSVKQLANNNLLVVGNFTSINGTPRNRVAKLNANGQVDASFNVDSSLIFPTLAIETMSDGRILLAGSGFSNLVVLNADGSLNAFLPSVYNTNGTIYDAAVQADGKILIGGDFIRIGSATRYGLARLNGVESFVRKTLFDYDGDGRADVSVFRPSNGVWYSSNSSSGFAAVQFGAAGDVLAPADYDGDGKTDVAVFRPSNGTWYWLNSSNNTLSAVGFGGDGDIPAPADYDADGKADVSVFRPSVGTWFRTNSADNGFVATQFGANGDTPTAGDFDGDGKADLAVYRPSNNVWYRLNSGSNNSFAAVQFGAAGDVLVPADYDGDGKTDVSVFRPSNNVWYRLNSSDSQFVGVGFGTNGDKPAPGDYDGDGKADIAVFRPSNGTWYLQMSTTGFTARQFGASEDVPTAGAFVR